ncbi:hypothetical protein CEUSTIGMA_g3124.t1 [Chlamydomonas eustigma]|uniref:Uncharacterized protein n=1 Tax=Chlamydomonas eustigma TaxID=1157962 RepID=A0A250WXY2_9CHLO|nr:hypothetical protein CEUSTIGMA_g3124.t1 [Chlamydomonas eustigma]|eukprot:GAX75681.1 hypothetical protein CEUSTIGMA_g3124.t1 [Chlamydomonas eustigma]
MAYRRNAKEDKPLAPFEGRVTKWEKKFVPYVVGKVNGEVRLELMKWQKTDVPRISSQIASKLSDAQNDQFLPNSVSSQVHATSTTQGVQIPPTIGSALSSHVLMGELSKPLNLGTNSTGPHPEVINLATDATVMPEQNNDNARPIVL